jgi:hypothetical protein
LFLVPTVAAVVAATLFLLQGGFGGGHGRFDRAIGLLGLPGILLSPGIAQAADLPLSDFVVVALLPAVLNVLMVSLIVVLVRPKRRAING